MRLTDPIMLATVAGARSVGIRGWRGEECESAALECLVRKPCLSTAHAYRQGRSAALDELRTLTHYRRVHPERTISLGDRDVVDAASEFDDRVVYHLDTERAIRRMSPNRQEVVRMYAQGYKPIDIARRLGISAGRVTQLTISIAVGL